MTDSQRRRRLEACARTARKHGDACVAAEMPLAAARAYQAAADHETMAAQVGRRRGAAL